MKFKSFLLATALIGTASTPGFTADNLSDALKEGEAGVNFRYRYESVEDDGFAEDASASTLRTNFWFRTGSFNDFSAFLEVQNVIEVGSDNYNDTVNGKTQYPVVADPAGTEINQIYVAYAGIPQTQVVLGRQAVNLGNERFVGSVGFRQNDQTVDAAVFVNNSIENLTAIYGYVDNVNRINGDDHPFGDLETETHLLHLEYAASENIKLTGYGYWIDLDDAAVASLSSQTFGARIDGSHEVANGVEVSYALEYANQSDHGDNPINYDADYIAAEVGVSKGEWTVTAGYEELGSDDGAAAFQTPLATGHKFNGVADKFITTPVDGLQDTYVKVNYASAEDGPLKGLNLSLAYHDFQAENGGADYGSEIDVAVSKKINERYSVGLKAAQYEEDGFGDDTTKIWVTLSANF